MMSVEIDEAIRGECLELARAYWPEDDVRILLIEQARVWVKPRHGDPFLVIEGKLERRTALLSLRDALRRLTGVTAEGTSLADQRDQLWQLLDDIDTLDDSCREFDAEFRDRVRAVQKKRWDIWNPEVKR